MKVACILITHFPLKTETQRNPELRQRPVLIVRTAGSCRVVADFSPGLAGVRPRMPLQKAATFAKSATLLESDDAYYQAQFDNILDALAERSPVVEDGGLGCAYVGLDGLDELYGGDARLVLALQTAVPDCFKARVGIGSGKFCAYLAAMSAEPERPFKAPSNGQDFVRGFSVEVLPVDFRFKARLHEFALHTLGDLAVLPVGALQAQFGPEGKLIWDLANGVDARSLIPREYDEAVSESLSFPDPVGTLEPILLGAEVLLSRVFLRPELRGRCARLALVEGRVYRRATWATRVTFKEPVGEPRQAIARVRGRLESTAMPGPLEDLTLTLRDLTGEAGRQGQLFSDTRKHDQVRDAIRQLDAVYGKPSPVFQVREVEPWSRIPERRHMLLPVAR
jgi:DNA polymerase-4/protein ImuB